MLPYMTSGFANCHSQHKAGRLAAEAVENAREQVASLINAKSPNEIIFTSGATESNNIAIKGVARYAGEVKDKTHLITSKIEHKCALESVKSLEQEGFTGHYLNVDKEGFVLLDELQDVLNTYGDKVAICSIIAANNEVGTVQDLKAIGNLCHQYNVPLHSDCAQLLGKKPLDVQQTPVDIISISGHKLYGPKGVGALYINKQAKIHLKSLFSGGGQENNIRSGTLPVFLTVGLGEAANQAKINLYRDQQHYESLFNAALDELKDCKHKINGPMNLKHRIANNMNVSFPGVEGESLLLACDDKVAFSTGSACASKSLSPSHVLEAMKVPDELMHTAVRLSWGRFTNEEEVRNGLKKIKSEVKRLREISCLWDEEDVQEVENVVKNNSHQ